MLSYNLDSVQEKNSVFSRYRSIYIISLILSISLKNLNYFSCAHSHKSLTILVLVNQHPPPPRLLQTGTVRTYLTHPQLSQLIFFSPLIHFLLLLTLLLERRLSFRKSWRFTWSTPKPVFGLSGGGDSQGWKGGLLFHLCR